MGVSYKNFDTKKILSNENLFSPRPTSVGKTKKMGLMLVAVMADVARISGKAAPSHRRCR